ncbi:MAG: M20/M25/M40 family metallo-hydrolase, partial [Blastocatellia bacterium]
VRTRLLEVEGVPPVVYGELPSPGATRTITFYAHYDGQPVDPRQWQDNPFTPVLRDKRLEDGGRPVDMSALPEHLNPEWRLYARSSGDDKVPIIGMVAALDALKASGIHPSVNLKFFFEGEEEAGSPHLQSVLDRFGDLLKTDAWMLCDGPVHQSNRIEVFFGARGTTDLEMTVYGPNRALHSGHYGNWAPNPIVMLTHLLDSMRDQDAHILIPGYYDDVKPITDADRRALAELPEVDQALKKELGLDWVEGGGASLAQQILKPALNVRGILGGHVGAQAANAISTEATASIDLRLVPDQTPENVRKRVEDFIAHQGYFIVRQAPDLATRLAHPKIVRLNWGPGYAAARTAMDLPISKDVAAAIESTLGEPIVKMPALGGSIPMYLFQSAGDVKGGDRAPGGGRVTGGGRVPVIGIAIANYDDNQHTANENLRLGNLWQGIEVYAGLFAKL